VPLLSLLSVVVENNDLLLFVLAVVENSPLEGFASPPGPGVDPLENSPPVEDSFPPFAVLPRLNKPPPPENKLFPAVVVFAVPVENKPPVGFASLLPVENSPPPPESFFSVVVVEKSPPLPLVAVLVKNPVPALSFLSPPVEKSPPEVVLLSLVENRPPVLEAARFVPVSKTPEPLGFPKIPALLLPPKRFVLDVVSLLFPKRPPGAEASFFVVVELPKSPPPEVPPDIVYYNTNKPTNFK